MKKNETKDLTGVKEIARRANVSIATVDRVIHNRVGVSESTKQKIKKIIQELDYQPNILAQRLASRKKIRIATLIPKSSLETSFWEAPLKGIAEAAAAIGKMGIELEQYFYDQNLRESYAEQTQQILEQAPDGVMIAPTFIEESIRFTELCKEKGIPYVLINSDLPNEGSLCYIGPDLYQSGYLNAHLISYLIRPQDKILIINISREIENHHYLLKKEEGFRSYFTDRKRKANIIRLDINKTDSKSIERALSKMMKEHEDVKLLFVTNSRVSDVAKFIEHEKNKVLLVGYDFLPKNIEYLEKEIIDFLICQKPQEQAFRGVMALYQHLTETATIEKMQFMPIDILTKENYRFYKN